MKQETIQINGRDITFETGEIAKQANGAVIVRQKDTIILVTVVAEEEPRPGMGFFPLTVEYREKKSATGSIPGGFIKRESRPQEHEILASRLIDRSIRPLFPDGFLCETQVLATVMSYDKDADPEPLAILGAALALAISEVPWSGPLGGLRVVQKNDQLIVLPEKHEREDTALDLMVSCSKDGIVMVEGISDQVSEDCVIEALDLAQKSLAPFFELMNKWQCTEKREVVAAEYPEELEAKVHADLKEQVWQVLEGAYDKKTRKKELKKVVENLKEKYLPAEDEENSEREELEGQLRTVIDKLTYKEFRQYMKEKKKRADGRDFRTVRGISGRVNWLPRSHGSAIFTRGETQALVSCTLGPVERGQIVETLDGETKQNFLLHYNFPPYSVGEAKPLRSPGRREIGHGNLALRSLVNVLPTTEEFPYTIRVISDISESNGSSSMATVCGGCLSIMDAGIPIKKPVAGVAMGLIKEDDEFLILSDILGDEDHLGDMDFKVAGTDSGVTAVQLDNKVGSLSKEIMKQALEQAKESRLHILEEMAKILPESKSDLSPYAPRCQNVKIRKERIRDLIGPGGKNIQEIQNKTGAQIDIDSNTGQVRIYTPDENTSKEAVRMVDYLTKEIEVDKIYRGTVVSVKDFGAFVRIFASTEGLVHISELEPRKVDNIHEVIKAGEEVVVKVLGVDRQGKISLSRKKALNAKESEIEN